MTIREKFADLRFKVSKYKDISMVFSHFKKSNAGKLYPPETRTVVFNSALHFERNKMAKKKTVVKREPLKIKKTRKLSEEHKEKLRTRLAEMRAKKKPA